MIRFFERGVFVTISKINVFKSKAFNLSQVGPHKFEIEIAEFAQEVVENKLIPKKRYNMKN